MYVLFLFFLYIYRSIIGMSRCYVHRRMINLLAVIKEYLNIEKNMCVYSSRINLV